MTAATSSPTGTREPDSSGATDPPVTGTVPGPTCSIEQALDLVGDRWSMLILRDSFRGLRRFDEIRRDLGIPRAVLADRLKRLVDAGILARWRYQEHPPRDEYRLTPMGRELSPILVALMRWGDRWLQEGDPPTVLVHSDCGEPFELGFHCSHCGVDFGPLEVASRTRRDALVAGRSTGEDQPEATAGGRRDH